MDVRDYQGTAVSGPVASMKTRLRRISVSSSRHSTRVLRATYPRAVSSLGRHGVLIGYDSITGNAFGYDPFLSYMEAGFDHVSNPNLVVAGGIGQGKTNLVMSYLARQAVFGRKIRVFSVKQGEYDNFAQLTGATVVKVTPGGTTILNPLDATRTGDRIQDAGIRPARLAALGALIETRIGRELQADEASALGLCLDEVVATNDEPSIPQVLAMLQVPVDGLLEELRLSREAWASRLYAPSQALYNLCRGEYAGLFNGHTSPEMRLDADTVVFDLEPLTHAGRFALPMFMAVASGHLQATLARETNRNLIVAYEEGWRALSHEGVVRFMQESWKLARSYGMQNLIVLHRASDFDAGSDGSLTSKLARGLLADTATKIIYRPEAHERAATGQMLALAPDEIHALHDLRVGEALWRIDSRATIVRHVRSRLEAELFSTDTAMTRQQHLQEVVA